MSGRLTGVARYVRDFRRSRLDSLLKSGKVSLGRHSYSRAAIRIFTYDDTKLHIGNFTSVAEGVVFILGGNHPLDRVTTSPLRVLFNDPGAGRDGHPSSGGDIWVGHDVWIASNAVVVSGVTIGSGAVVAAGAVVTADVPPYAIVAGVPARILRYRFEQDVIDALLRIQWWEWPDDRVRAHLSELADGHPKKFIERFGDLQ